ncbi:MAG: hypothetical protein K0R27_285 [Xanthobacteraceae bacterium]|jgi:hypothetical protein|nr:hypothetical protein [Xanthobacteraceae bacterium]
MSKQLSGPWTVTEDFTILDDEGHCVCVVGDPFDKAAPQDKERAAAIAALPELLDFVREVARRDPVFAKGHEKQRIRDAAYLVAKAEGR